MTALVNTETGELVEVTYADVRQSIDSAKASLEEAAEQIVWQIENHVWTVLGYADWNEMREAEYGGAAFMVPRADRPELTARMRRAGLSTNDIAATAGVSDDTVRRDLETADAVSGTVLNSRGQSRPATYSKPTPELAPEVEAAVEEFPELDHYAKQGRDADVVRLAGALRNYDEGEREVRRGALRATVAAEQRGPIAAPPISTTRLNKVIGAYANGNSIASGTTFDELAAQAPHLNEVERLLGIGALGAAIEHATRLLEVLNQQPTLRRIK